MAFVPGGDRVFQTITVDIYHRQSVERSELRLNRQRLSLEFAAIVAQQAVANHSIARGVNSLHLEASEIPGVMVQYVSVEVMISGSFLKPHCTGGPSALMGTPLL